MIMDQEMLSYEEYEKLMAALGLLDTGTDANNNDDCYFDAWYFGQPKGDSQFTISTN